MINGKTRAERRTARKRQVKRGSIAVAILAILAGLVIGGVALFDESDKKSVSTENVNDIEVPKFGIKDDAGNDVPYHITSAVKWTAPPKDLNCPDDKVTFFAYQGTGNAFGPDQREKINTAEDVVKRLHEKACDPLFTKGTDMFFRDGAGIDGPTIESEARKLKDTKIYQETVKSVSNQIDSIYVADLQVAYESAGMIPGSDPSVMPTITKWGDRPVLGKTAVVVLKNGEYRLLRIECDLQWSVIRFVKISAPVRVSAPPRGGGTPPPVIRTTTRRPPPPPPCCQTTPPPPPPPPCCETTTPPPPPPPPLCPNGQPIPPSGLCEKPRGVAPGDGGPGDGGPGGGQPGGGDTEGQVAPQAGDPPAIYTPMPVPTETSAPPAPQVTVAPPPSNAPLPSVDTGSQTSNGSVDPNSPALIGSDFG